LDLIAIAAGNNFSTLLNVQNITVYKIKEHSFWQAEHSSSYIAGLGSELHEPENASTAVGKLSFKFMTATGTKGRLWREQRSKIEY